MALVRVKDNTTGEIGHVDEAWLERWPEDFTPAPEDAPAPAAAPAAPEPEQRSRRSNDF